MFTLKRRIPSYSNEDNADFNRTIVFDEVKSINGLSCTTPSPKRNRTDRVLSPISQFSPKGPLNGTSKPQSRVRFVRGLSKNQKSRISIYLQLLNMFVAALVAAKDKSLLLFDIVRTKGLTENMHLAASVFITSILLSLSLALYAVVLTHQSLVWMCSDYLLLNVSFFSIQANQSASESSISDTKLKGSEESQSNGTSHLSAESSESIATPPAEAPAPQELSPIKRELRSESPAFDASANAKRVEMDSIKTTLYSVDTHTHPAVNNFPINRSRASPAIQAILTSRAASSPMMSFAPRPERNMSTISYPDTNGTISSEEDDARDAIRPKTKLSKVVDESEEEEEESSPQDGSNDDGLLYPNDDEEDPVPEVDVDIPFTSSPAPEKVEIVAERAAPVAQPIEVSPIKVEYVPAPRQSTPLSRSRSTHTPPPSRVTTIQAAPVQTGDPESVFSPRDIFSPTPQSMGSFPFAIPFLREQLQQSLPGANSASNTPAEVAPMVEANKADAEGEKKENIGEPTPYPSPPFTPPGSRPPTMYASMNELTVNVNPDSFVVEKSQLSSVVEEVKAEMEKAPTVTAPAQEAVTSEPATSQPQAVVEVESEPESKDEVEIAVSAPVEEEVVSVIEAVPAVVEVEESVPEVVEEIKMPTPVKGILRSRSSSVSSSQLNVAPSPRAVSPVRSIGRGGMTNGSRVDVEDLSRYSPAPTASVAPVASIAPAAPAAETAEPANLVTAPAENNDDEDDVVNGAAGSGADDESTAPKGKVDMKKKKKRTRRPKAKKGVSFDEQPTLIDTSMDEEVRSGDDETNSIASPSTSTRPAASILAGLVAAANANITNASSSANSAIPVPKTFEVVDDDEEPIPTLVSPGMSLEALRGSPIPMAMPRRASTLISEAMSPRSAAGELSDSSSTWLDGEFTPKQIDHYGRWFARAYRDKSLPTITMLRQQMRECSDSELGMRVKLGSRSESTKLTKTLMGEDKGGNSSSGGSVPPPVRRNSSYRRRR